MGATGGAVNSTHDDDSLFLWNDWPMKGVKPYFQPESLSNTIANFPHAASRISDCAEHAFMYC